MKNVIIQKMVLQHFKGIDNLSIQFNPQETFIGGDNGTGKTSVFDALLWVLFNRDSAGKSEFEIKTLDSHGKSINQLEHSVQISLLVNDAPIVLRKVFREKWTKKRGTNKAELTGHENLFYWNDVPMKESEYKVEVSKIVDEGMFKMLTNPLHFNEQLGWQARRKILIDMSLPVNEQEVLMQCSEDQSVITWLRDQFNLKKSYENIRAELSHKAKAIKDDLQSIPIRVDEVHKSKPAAKDYAAIRNQIELNNKKAQELTEAMKAINAEDSLVNQELRDALQQKQALEMELIEVNNKHESHYATKKYEYNKRMGMLESKRTNTTEAYNNALADYAQKEKHFNDLTEQVNKLRQEYLNAAAAKFNPSGVIDTCPTCQRKYEEGKILESHNNAKAKFAEDTEKLLKKIVDEANVLKARLENVQKEYTAAAALKDQLEQAVANSKALEDEIKELQYEMEQLEKSSKELPARAIEIQEALAAWKQPEGAPYKGEQRDRIVADIRELMDANNALQAELAEEKALDQVEARIKELNDQEQNLVQLLADIEGKLYAVEQFNKLKVEQQISSVNGLFNHVKFRLFTEQLNGGLSECCDTLINTNGCLVPFTSANNAGRINAGIDIINALSKYYQISAPIFIDNREGVNKLIPTDSQVVNLVVTKDPCLTLLDIS